MIPERIIFVSRSIAVRAKEEYIERHDRVCAQLHFNIYKEIRVKLKHKHWYEHAPLSVETSHDVEVTTLWNQKCKRVRTVTNTEPDFTFMLLRIVIDFFLINQPDALIIQNLFCYKTLPCFGHPLCPSSGVFHCTFVTGKFHAGF